MWGKIAGSGGTLPVRSGVSANRRRMAVARHAAEVEIRALFCMKFRMIVSCQAFHHTFCGQLN